MVGCSGNSRTWLESSLAQPVAGRGREGKQRLPGGRAGKGCVESECVETQTCQTVERRAKETICAKEKKENRSHSSGLKGYL